MALDLKVVPSDKQNEAKAAYVKALKQYSLDTNIYFSDRRALYRDFCEHVSKALAPYRNTLAGSTDLKTSIEVADRAFSYWHIHNATNFIILYTVT